MTKKAEKIHASTQKFTEIVDVVDDIVIMEGGNAALIIEITASNFALLSQKEQDSKIFSYAALLNSLTFPIQIVIRNRRVDISSYLKLLEQQEKETKNPMLAEHIRLYRDFVRDMVRVNVVLSKQFYIVLSYNSLEAGVTGATKTVGKSGGVNQMFIAQAKKILEGKAESIQGQVRKLAVSARVLQKEELVKLYYEVYNENLLDAGVSEEDVKAPMVKANQ
jgi:hypothetical protein